mmetsp:Transcript_11393/g.18876  ORF Transcript_11393/g.18876 Transcript_11393/m.18876 type:complete len:199 (+) Transcript_11393:76-672(+)
MAVITTTKLSKKVSIITLLVLGYCSMLPLLFVQAEDATPTVLTPTSRTPDSPSYIQKTTEEYALSAAPPQPEMCVEGVCTTDTTTPTMLPINAVYQVKFSFPLLGDYVVNMYVLSANQAKLIVDGGFPLRGVFDYQLSTNKKNRVTFHVQLPQRMRDILERYTVTLSEIRYNVEEDAPSVVVAILYIITFPLKLKRVR